jgi:hypothetical protein
MGAHFTMINILSKVHKNFSRHCKIDKEMGFRWEKTIMYSEWQERMAAALKELEFEIIITHDSFQ